MPPPIKQPLAKEAVAEILAMYADPTIAVGDIEHTFNISSSRLYRLLEQAGVPSRQAAASKAKPKADTNEHTGTPGTPAPTQPEADPATTVYVNNKPMTVHLDKHDTVVATERAAGPAKPQWVVAFMGQVQVSGDSIDQALQEARKLGIVRQVYEVRRL